jgi:branched-chain amino acid transport system substrate-binding protein
MLRSLFIALLITMTGALLIMHEPAPARAADAPAPVYVGLDAEVGHATSTSDDAIRMGILAAMDEINRAGGVLGGRPLELIVKDNRSVPARGVSNIRALAEVPGLVAVIGGKFSPVMLEELDVLHELKVILLDPWGAADGIVDNGRSPNYCFRLSLKDSWAIQTMMERARSIGARRIGVLLPVTGWGRSNQSAIEAYQRTHNWCEIAGMEWHNWGDKTMLHGYDALVDAGADAILLITNEAEGSLLVREMAELPEARRLPIISHWGVSGGAFTTLTGPAIESVDFTVVQTYSFFDQKRPGKLAVFYETMGRLFNVHSPEEITSPVGVAHAYDLTHILARAIDLAGTTDRPEVRDALERVAGYDGLIKRYARPFTPERHEALDPADLFMGRFRASDGSILRARD